MLMIFLMTCWTLAVSKQVRGKGGGTGGALRGTIAVTAGIVLTKGGCNSALAVGGGRESKGSLPIKKTVKKADNVRFGRPPPLNG